jgi:ABC-type phosphate/phosphonate transport system ATPase subunit
MSASVRVEHATFRYPGGTAGIFDITFDIAPGELVVCIGPQRLWQDNVAEAHCGISAP